MSRPNPSCLHPHQEGAPVRSRWLSLKRRSQILIVPVLLLIPLLYGGVSANTELLKKEGVVILSTKNGEHCLVLGVLLDENGIAFIYRGRRVTLHRDAIATFVENPSKYFSKLQPRGALFQEDETWSLGLGWLFLGVWMTLGLACGAAASHLALRKGRSPGFWFAAGVATNLVALATLLMRPTSDTLALPNRLAKIPNTSPPLRCPECQAENHPTAKACSSCGAILAPAMESEIQRT